MFLNIYLFFSYYYFLFNSMIESNIERKKKNVLLVKITDIKIKDMWMVVI